MCYVICNIYTRCKRCIQARWKVPRNKDTPSYIGITIYHFIYYYGMATVDYIILIILTRNLIIEYTKKNASEMNVKLNVSCRDEVERGEGRGEGRGEDRIAEVVLY